VVSLPAVTTRLYSSDEIQYFAFLRSLWFDHDVSFENEYQYFYDHGVAKSDGFHATFLELKTATGRRINFGTIGCAILWSPFYAAGDLAARATGAPRDGYSKPYVAGVAYGSAFYGFLALVLAIRCAERLGFRPFRAALAVWIGTPLLFYMYVAPPFSHACSAFAVALFTWVWLTVRGEWSTRGLIALAAAGALMTMTREQDAFFIGGPAIDFLLGQNLAAKAKGLAAAAIAFWVVFAPQAAAYLTLNGHIGPDKSVGNKMQWWAPHAGQVLFSPAHGYVFWTPLAVIGIAGLVVMLKDVPRVAACLLVMVALQMYVGGSVASWTVAGGFAQRRLVALTTALVIGLAALDAQVQSRGWRAALTGLVLLTMYWNVALMAEFATGLMDRQKLEPARNAHDAFITLPRMAPDLAYRYLFDRKSFYR